MTLKHIEDDGDLSVLVNDIGTVLLVCVNGHQWVGTNFKPAGTSESETARRGLAQSIRVSSASPGAFPGMDLDVLER